MRQALHLYGEALAGGCPGVRHGLTFGVAAPASAAPIAAKPAVVASPAPHVDWATGFELPKAPTATYDAPTLGATTEYKAPAAEVPAAVPEPPKVPGASP